MSRRPDALDVLIAELVRLRSRQLTEVAGLTPERADARARTELCRSAREALRTFAAERSGPSERP